MGYESLRSHSPEEFFIALAIRLLLKSNTGRQHTLVQNAATSCHSDLCPEGLLGVRGVTIRRATIQYVSRYVGRDTTNDTISDDTLQLIMHIDYPSVNGIFQVNI